MIDPTGHHKLQKRVERLIKEETLEGPVFESLFNQQLNEEQDEALEVVAGGVPSIAADIQEEEPKRLPMPRASYSMPSQTPHTGESTSKKQD